MWCRGSNPGLHVYLLRILPTELCSQFPRIALSTLLIGLATQLSSLFGIRFFKMISYIMVYNEGRPYFVFIVLCVEGTLLQSLREMASLPCLVLLVNIGPHRCIFSQKTHVWRGIWITAMVFTFSEWFVAHPHLQVLDVVRKHGKGSVCRRVC